MNRTKMTIKELREECSKRDIGFMGNWSKPAIIRRLKEEDDRDAEIRELTRANKKEIGVLTSRPEDIYHSLCKQSLIYLDDYNQCMINVERVQKKKEQICNNRDKVKGRLMELMKKIQGLEESGILGDVEFIEVDYDVNGTIYKIKKLVHN